MRYLLVYTPLCLLLALSACELPREVEPVIAPVVAPVVVPAETAAEAAAIKEVGVIRALSDNGCLIKKFSTTTGVGSRATITATCGHVEVLSEDALSE